MSREVLAHLEAMTKAFAETNVAGDSAGEVLGSYAVAWQSAD